MTASYDSGINNGAPHDTADGFTIADTLLNLIPDPSFVEGGGDWALNGKAFLDNEVSRNTKDKHCITFTGEGDARYSIPQRVPEGAYTLRYFLYGKGGVKRADMTVCVNGQETLKMPYERQEWWYEYASQPFHIPEGAEVSVTMTADGGRDMILHMDNINLLKIPYDAPEPVSGENPVSRLVNRGDGTYYIEVNGKPFQWRGAHTDTSKTYDFDFKLQKVKETGSNVFVIGLTWSSFQSQPTEEFDFDEIDRAIAAAEKYDMYLSVNWCGSVFCSNTSTSPAFIADMHSVHSKDPDTGECEKSNIDSEGKIIKCMCEYNNAQLLKLEGAVLGKLMEYLAEKDTQRRVIAIQLLNEASEAIYNSKVMSYEMLAKHLDALGRVIKESPHPMLTFTNQGYGSVAHFIFNTPYLDYNGVDTYTVNMYTMDRVLHDRFNSRFIACPESGGYDVSPAQLAAAYVNDAHINFYPLDEDTYWGRPGLYDGNMEPLEYTRGIAAINRGAASLGSLLVTVPLGNKTSFNTAKTGVEDDLSEVKTLDGVRVRFETVKQNGSAGLAVKEGNAVFCMASKAACFSVFAKGVKAHAGSVDNEGNFIIESELPLQDAGDGSFRIQCDENTTVRFSFDEISE